MLSCSNARVCLLEIVEGSWCPSRSAIFEWAVVAETAVLLGLCFLHRMFDSGGLGKLPRRSRRDRAPCLASFQNSALSRTCGVTGPGLGFWCQWCYPGRYHLAGALEAAASRPSSTTAVHPRLAPRRASAALESSVCILISAPSVSAGSAGSAAANTA